MNALTEALLSAPEFVQQIYALANEKLHDDPISEIVCQTEKFDEFTAWLRPEWRFVRTDEPRENICVFPYSTMLVNGGR